MKYIKHSPTSEEAAHFAEGFAGHAREQVYLYILRHGGATDDDVQAGLGMKHQTESPRRVELEEAGYIRDSGVTRPTRSGCHAVVWVVTDKRYLNSVFAARTKQVRVRRQAEQELLAAARAYAKSPVAENVGRLLAAAFGLDK